MKKLTKRIAITVSAIVLLFGGFTLGVYASGTWLSYSGGEEEVSHINNNTKKILNMLSDVENEKISISEAKDKISNELKASDELNSSLQDGNDKLRDEIDRAGTQKNEDDKYIEHLEKQVEQANEDIKDLREQSDSDLEEARKIVGEESQEDED